MESPNIEDFTNQGTESSRFKVAKVDNKKGGEGDVVEGDAGMHGGEVVGGMQGGQDTEEALEGVKASGDRKDSLAEKKTFGNNTLETLPHIDHYRNLLSTTGQLRSRPTLLELHDLEAVEESSDEHLLDKTATQSPIIEQGAKFGWIQGVLVRCVLNIFGVMLFLRLTWVVGQAGIGLAVAVILLASVVTVITTLSMSAISTNGIVKGGGAYYMISRSLGPEYGGAIGLVFSLANAVAVAMYVVGFAETIRDILVDNDSVMIDHINDVRVMGIVTCFGLAIITLAGMGWEAKAQMVLLLILLVAICNYFVGSFMPASAADVSRGFVGYNWATMKENFYPSYRGENFFSVFAIYFPAATGILAGANISGDLKDAQQAIPKGTLLAILLTSIVYIVVAISVGSLYMREQIAPFASSILNNHTTQMSTAFTSLVHNASSPLSSLNLTCVDVPCPYGLLKDMRAIQISSAYGPITIAGIISATLSSALASLISAPKVFQAVCKDNIFPYIGVFAKGYGKTGEPRLASFLAFVIAIACVCIGDLNLIAPLISNFFLMSYALVNFSCFDASVAKSPGWRPSFKYYNKWLSLIGAVLCIVVMFVMSWSTALITIGIVTALFTYVHYRKPDINWGSSTQAHVYKDALTNTLKLICIDEHVKNYRPQILVLTGLPETREALVDLCTSITKGTGLMVCANVLQASTESRLLDMRQVARRSQLWLANRKTKSFYSVVIADSLRKGVQSMLQVIGLGKLKPNIVMMGFMNDWSSRSLLEIEEYYNIINDAFDLHYGVGILRLQGGLFRHCPVATQMPYQLQQQLQQQQQLLQQQTCKNNGNGTLLSPMHNEEEVDTKAHFTTASDDEEEEDDLPRDGGEAGGMEDLFKNRQSRGFIDVWWLFDDGGLTLLIPYLLSQRKLWRGCQLRVYIAASKQSELLREQRQMATLLSKFRIEYSSLVVITDVNKTPSDASIMEFRKLVSKLKVTEEELVAQVAKTHRHLRLKELLKEHSSEAKLIVMSLPMPRRGLQSGSLYLVWLHTLTSLLPPILLLRGNQDNVLTFYS